LRLEELPFGAVSPASEEVDDGTYPVEKDYNQHPDNLVITRRFVLSTVDDHPNPERKKKCPEDAHTAVEHNEKKGNRLCRRERVGLHKVGLYRWRKGK
jgi:hypothetical protein